MSGRGVGPEAGSGYPIPRPFMLPLVVSIAVIIIVTVAYVSIK